jgi:hypothetical protein
MNADPTELYAADNASDRLLLSRALRAAFYCLRVPVDQFDCEWCSIYIANRSHCLHL